MNVLTDAMIEEAVKTTGIKLSPARVASRLRPDEGCLLSVCVVAMIGLPDSSLTVLAMANRLELDRDFSLGAAAGFDGLSLTFNTDRGTKGYAFGQRWRRKVLASQ